MYHAAVGCCSVVGEKVESRFAIRLVLLDKIIVIHDNMYRHHNIIIVYIRCTRAAGMNHVCMYVLCMYDQHWFLSVR